MSSERRLFNEIIEKYILFIRMGQKEARAQFSCGNAFS
jgi:hypothetical protein